VPPPIDSSIGEDVRGLFAAFEALVASLDPRVRMDGDRFSRRATFEGRVLCDCWFAEQRLHGAVPGASPRQLLCGDDVRALGDLMARRYLEVLGAAKAGCAPAPAESSRSTAVARGGMDALRASMSAARLSHEEASAFADLEREDVEEGPLASG
jgi:hypothetical protein